MEQPLRILFADDNDDIRVIASLYFEEILGPANFSLALAKDGEEALLRIQEQAFDIAFLDLSMPRRDGWSLAQYLKNDTALRELPLIAVSAHAMERDRLRAMNAGFNAYMTKPIYMDDLRRVLAETLEHRAPLA